MDSQEGKGRNRLRTRLPLPSQQQKAVHTNHELLLFYISKKNPTSLAPGLTTACASSRAKNQTAPSLKNRLHGVSIL